MDVVENTEIPVAAGLLFGFLMFSTLGVWGIALPLVLRGRRLLPKLQLQPVPWTSLEVFLGFLLWLGMSLVIPILCQSLGLVSGDESTRLIDAFLILSVVNFLTVFGIIAVTRERTGATLTHWGVDSRSLPAQIGIGIVGALLALLPTYIVQAIAIQIWVPNVHPLQNLISEAATIQVALLAVVSAVILAPVAEEFLFRGLLQGWLESKIGVTNPQSVEDDPADRATTEENTWDPFDSALIKVDQGLPKRRKITGTKILVRSIPIVIPALLFAGIHAAQWPAPIPLFVFALGLGILYRKTGSVVPPIVAHAVFNGISTILSFVLFQSGAVSLEPEGAERAERPVIRLEQKAGLETSGDENQEE